MFMKQTKLFRCDTKEALDQEIESFLQENNADVVDIVIYPVSDIDIPGIDLNKHTAYLIYRVREVTQ